MKYTNTDKAPAAIGPYSQAVTAGGFLFISGQTPFSPETGETIGTDVAGQAEQACKNIGEILKANDLTFEDVVKTTCFLDDINDFAAFNAIYAESFGETLPARSCVAVDKLPKGALVEVEVIAEVVE